MLRTSFYCLCFTVNVSLLNLVGMNHGAADAFVRRALPTAVNQGFCLHV